MEKIAIIDHATHQLWIEDISDEDLEKFGGEEEYIKEYYRFEGDWSWDYIVDAAYIPMGESDPIDIDFETL